MKALLTLLKSDAKQVDALSIQQVIALCGDGRLTDDSECSHAFRSYLQIAKSENLFNYARMCMQTPFERSGSALQDIVNECGRRLDYTVENGLYQGKVNAIGNDGLWTDTESRAIVVEVKTTDTYRINLDTIAAYREKLIAQSSVGKQASVLLVVGRQDTGDLEAQVRGSRHAWNIRIISVDALAKLVELKENTDTTSVAQIHELLVPFEYTRLDKIIEIAFTVAEDASSAVDEVQEVIADEGQLQRGTRIQEHTSREVLNEIRNKLVAKLSSSYAPLVKKSRALYWSPDKTVRAAVTISKKYSPGEDFWYAYHDTWDKFLGEASTGIYVLGCVGRPDAFIIPYTWVHKRLAYLNVTQREEGSHFHVSLYPEPDGELMLVMRDGVKESLKEFRVVLDS